MSPAFHTSKERRTISTFSCDIASRISLLPQPSGFEGLATQSQCAKGAFRDRWSSHRMKRPWRSHTHW